MRYAPVMICWLASSLTLAAVIAVCAWLFKKPIKWEIRP